MVELIQNREGPAIGVKGGVWVTGGVVERFGTEVGPDTASPVSGPTV
ncbi:hypothetical protein [Streptomyces sp. NPDC001020]